MAIGGINPNPFGSSSGLGSIGGGLNPGSDGAAQGFDIGGSDGSKQGVGGIADMVSAQTPDDGQNGASFGSMLSDMVLKKPGQSQQHADDLAASFAAGADVDPHTLAIATAKAGIEVQMATRTISQAVQGIRTLMQTQI